jgi:hypothetical protein
MATAEVHIYSEESGATARVIWRRGTEELDLTRFGISEVTDEGKGAEGARVSLLMEAKLVRHGRTTTSTPSAAKSRP